VRARALSTSIVCILAVGLMAVPAMARTRQVTPASSNTCALPPATTPTAPATPPPNQPAPPASSTPTASASSSAGGAAYGVDPSQTPVVPSACIYNGKAYPPAGAPIEIQQAIWSANEIVGKPYKYGGGHAKLHDTGYDCSGTVSYALIGGQMLDSPLDSGSFMKWGAAGPGTWVTVYTNPGHAFAVIAGLRLDTSAAGDPTDREGPQWRPILRDTKGFKARHPEGF
jgi:cell wall-associated NlpC family hydrolase